MNIIKLPDKITEYPIWQEKNKFIYKLKAVEDFLKYNNNYTNKKKVYICILCKKKIKVIFYKSPVYLWESTLYHIIDEHNYKPNKIFIKFIFDYKININTTIKRVTIFKSHKYVINNLSYVKLTNNQLMILDALMEHGGYKKKYHKYSKKKLSFVYSEHSGLLDFDNSGLERIIVSGKTDRKDPSDNTIFLPNNLDDAIDYEYIFHTHPPTPTPGGRAKDGILYEFPSISDLFHFIDHFNDGITQGSIVVTSEGIYNIRKLIFNEEKININENKLLDKMRKTLEIIQDLAIEKYGIKFTDHFFYSKIAQDKTYINMYNDSLKEFKLFVDFFPRSLDKNGSWILEEIYLPIFIIEKK